MSDTSSGSDDSERTPLRIAFVGKPGAGKDTAAAHFPDAVVVRFAAPVYMIADAWQRQHGVPVHKDRALLRRVATCGQRMCGRDIWAQFAEWAIADNYTCDIVVPDLRFMHELVMLRRHAFKIVRIVRDADVRAESHEDAHVTESELDAETFDMVKNDGDIAHLWQQLDDVVASKC